MTDISTFTFFGNTKNLIELHIVGNPNLTCVQVSENQLAKLDVGELPGWENPMNVPHLLNCN